MKLSEVNKALQSIATLLETNLIEATASREELISFFKDDSNTDDSKVHALADKLGIDPHELEGQVYKLLNDALNGRLMKHWNVPDDKFNSGELKTGIAVEMEHTDDPDIAKIIAKAHLLEMPNDYYKKLKKMESIK